MRYTAFCGFAIIVMLFSVQAIAQQTQDNKGQCKDVAATRIEHQAPTIDGNLNDSIWISLRKSATGGFTQRNPYEGKPASESTFVAVAYDNDALYVAFWCYDSEPDKIIKPLVRRDRLTQCDRVYVMLDPQHEHQSGYCFMTNAAGVLRDVRFYNDTQQDETWDAVFEGNAKVQPWGWTAEFRIPYYCLRFPEKDIQSWGVNFTRYIGHKAEYVFWNFNPTSMGGAVSRFGHLDSLKDLHPVSQLQVLPYAVTKLETDTATSWNKDGKKFSANTGLDLKYALASDLVLDATINPDFGQVELDQPVLNLTTFESFFSEKRPFFLEGANFFQTGYNLFYSRRIGGPPRWDVSDPEAAFDTDNPTATTILGAAKLTGKIGQKTTLAALTAFTSEEKAKYGVISDSVPYDTTYRKGVVEPFANYSVVRLKQDIWRFSSLAGMLTSVTQDGVLPAITGGVDWRLVTNDRSWSFSGQTIFTHANNKDGQGITLTLAREASKHLTGSLYYRQNSRRLNFNRIGFQYRPNFREGQLTAIYRTNDEWGIIRTTTSAGTFYSQWNMDGVNVSQVWDVETNIEFTNSWLLRCHGVIEGQKYSDLETRGKGLWQLPKHPSIYGDIKLNSDSRKPIYLGAALQGGQDRGGTWWGVEFESTFRPKSNLEFNFSGGREQYRNATRWLANWPDPIFAELNHDAIHFETSNSILIRRNLSLQVSAQCLINGLAYSKYRYYYFNGNQYIDSVEDYKSSTLEYYYDGNNSSFNSMILLRWEYLPGSTLYLVWTRTRDQVDNTANNLDLSRDLKRLFSYGSKNIFLLKMSYWINM